MQDAAALDVDERVGRTLFCKGLTQQVTQSLLYELFLIAGPIQCIHLPRARPPEAEQTPAEGPGRAGLDGKRAAVDGLVVTCEDEDHSRRRDEVGHGGLAVDGENASKESVAVRSDGEEKPYSIADKILYRHRVGEHQGYAFIVYCHVQSVDYAINIFRGTRLFGTQISMSPAKQAVDKVKEFSKFPEKDGNAAKSKSEIRQRQASVAGHHNAQGARRNRNVSNRNLNFKRDHISFERSNTASRNGGRMAQDIPPGKNYSGTDVYGSGIWQNHAYAENAPSTVQGNWRVRSDGNDRGFVAAPEGTCDSRDQWQYWRARQAPHDECARNSFGNAVPRPQTRSFRGSQRKTVLHASVPQLGRTTFEPGSPVIESETFLPLTPNLAPHGYDPCHEMAPPLVAPGPVCSPTIDPPLTPFELDQPQSKSPLAFSGDEHIPILFYEMDTKPEEQTFCGHVYVDGQAAPENWDSPHLMDENTRLMASLTLNEDGSMSEQNWAEQYAPLMSDGVSPPQLHYPLYDGSDEFSSCEAAAVTDSHIAYSEMQYVDPNHLNLPYVQAEYQGYGTEFEQWQSDHAQGMQGHVLNGHHVNHFDQSSQQIVNQLRLLNLGYDLTGRRPEPVTYTRVFGRGVEHDPATLIGSDDLTQGGAEWQNDRFYGGEQHPRDSPHRSQSVPCHVTQARAGCRARAAHSSANVEEVANGDWVSPVTWRSKGRGGAWPNHPDQGGAQRKPPAGRANRSSGNFGPLKNRPAPSPRSAKKPERRYTLSECIDTAFQVYRQGNAVSSPRSKQAGGGSGRKSNAF